MAVPRVVAIVALFFFAAGSAEMASKPLVGISREQSEPEMKVAGSVYYFEDENHVKHIMFSVCSFDSPFYRYLRKTK